MFYEAQIFEEYATNCSMFLTLNACAITLFVFVWNKETFFVFMANFDGFIQHSEYDLKQYVKIKFTHLRFVITRIKKFNIRIDLFEVQSANREMVQN